MYPIPQASQISLRKNAFDRPDSYNQKELNPDFDEVLSRLTDNSEHMEFRPGYGPEIYTGLCKFDGFLVGCIGNRQGWLGENYPEYADYPGIGGKLYRQGLIKMNEFVTLCGRDRVPVIWFQDTSGIDVGDIAEQAELLGLGQSLVYSIQQTDVPMMLVVLRKGSAAAHYVMGGPQRIGIMPSPWEFPPLKSMLCMVRLPLPRHIPAGWLKKKPRENPWIRWLTR